jgi:glucokinase
MILAADVGGTKTRLALFEERDGITCVDEKKYASRDFPNLSALLLQFLSQEDRKKITAACLGIAGPIKNGMCKATNLPWEISAKALEHEIQIPKVHLINDLEANAWGLHSLSAEEFFNVNSGEDVAASCALISPGTGLGEAGIYWNGKIHRPFPSEGGHCDFAPTDEEEIALLTYLKGEHPHVSYERVLSGSGLYRIYRFLIDTHREQEDPAIGALMKQNEPQRIITEKGINKQCSVCVRTCRLFVKLLGNESGNLALKFLSLGGVFIGGGIVPHLVPFLQEEGYMKAFMDKGRFSTVLSKIPVKVVLNDRAALHGAARYALEN